MTKRVVKFSAMLLGAALLSACVGVREHRGYVLDEQLAQSIQVGVDNKASVTKTLGLPTFTGQFDPNDWYYLSQDTHQFAFRDPRVTEQKLLHVRFDPAGNVTQVATTVASTANRPSSVSATCPSTYHAGRRASAISTA